MHALIIEDCDLIAMSIENVLEDCGFTSFDVAVSLDEAVAAAAKRCPDLITADVELKPGSGIEAVQTICSKTKIPVVFITGRADVARSRMPGCAVVSKPFRLAEVQATVRDVLNR